MIRTFEEYVAARWQRLVRSAVLLGADPARRRGPRADGTGQVLRRLAAGDPRQDPDAYVHRVLINALADSRRRTVVGRGAHGGAARGRPARRRRRGGPRRRAADRAAPSDARAAPGAGAALLRRPRRGADRLGPRGRGGHGQEPGRTRPGHPGGRTRPWASSRTEADDERHPARPDARQRRHDPDVRAADRGDHASRSTPRVPARWRWPPPRWSSSAVRRPRPFRAWPPTAEPDRPRRRATTHPTRCRCSCPSRRSTCGVDRQVDHASVTGALVATQDDRCLVVGDDQTPVFWPHGYEGRPTATGAARSSTRRAAGRRGR